MNVSYKRLIIGLINLVFGCVLSLMALAEYWSYESLEQNKAITEGRIIDRFVTDSGRNEPGYIVQYEFEFQNTRYTGEKGIDKDVYDTLEVGSPIRIEYDTQSPQNNQVAGENSPSLSQFLLIVSIFWIGGSILLMVVGWRGLRQDTPV